MTDRAGGELLHITGSEATSRTLALAYAQVAQFYTQYREKGYRLLQQAIRDYPDGLQLNETLGLIQLRVSQSDESLAQAARLLQTAIDQGSASGTIHYTLARLRLREGRVSAAIDLLKRGIGYEPHYSPTSLLLSEIYLRLGDSSRARDVAEAAIIYNPGDAELRRLSDAAEDGER